MKIIKGKPRYERTFFRFLEYVAQVKAASLKRNVICEKAFDVLCTHDFFKDYIQGGANQANIYSFYSKNKDEEFMKTFFKFRKQKQSNALQIKTYKKVTSTAYHKFYETKQWIRLSSQVKKIYGKKCMKCGDDKSIMHTDHIVPRSIDLSKELDINNLQVLCECCNIVKSNLNCNDYRTDIDKLKLNAFLNKEMFIHPDITLKSWLELNRKKIGKAQTEILIELWNKKQ
jgi:5-methylcytosine-specific restriction endonuclease McrA